MKIKRKLIPIILSVGIISTLMIALSGTAYAWGLATGEGWAIEDGMFSANCNVGGDSAGSRVSAEEMPGGSSAFCQSWNGPMPLIVTSEGGAYAGPDSIAHIRLWGWASDTSESHGTAWATASGDSRARAYSFHTALDGGSTEVNTSADAYNGAWEYIASLDISNREMEKYIIGTISGRDTPLSAALWADACDTMYFNQTGQEDLQQERDEILATTKEDLRHFSEMVKSAMDEEILCVIGGEEMVEANAQYFNEVKYIK